MNDSDLIKAVHNLDAAINNIEEETVKELIFNDMRERLAASRPSADIEKLVKEWQTLKLTRKLNVSFKKADGTPWNEYDNPGGMPNTVIHLNPLEDCIQIFIGTRVIGKISSFYLEMFKRGQGYEFIENWKASHFPFIKKLNGSQILYITELLRQYGHSKC